MKNFNPSKIEKKKNSGIFSRFKKFVAHFGQFSTDTIVDSNIGFMAFGV